MARFASSIQTQYEKQTGETIPVGTLDEWYSEYLDNIYSDACYYLRIYPDLVQMNRTTGFWDTSNIVHTRGYYCPEDTYPEDIFENEMDISDESDSSSDDSVYVPMARTNIIREVTMRDRTRTRSRTRSHRTHGVWKIAAESYWG